MEDIKKLLEDVIKHDLKLCLDDDLVAGEGSKEEFQKRQYVNELIKTYSEIVAHEDEMKFKERELKARENELKLGVGAEVNKLITSGASTVADIHKTNTGIKLAATAMDFEKGGNMFASQVSRSIPGLITKMVR